MGLDVAVHAVHGARSPDLASELGRPQVLGERTVEAHARRLLFKLDIADSEDANRRVLAILLQLGVRPAPTGDEIRYRQRP